MRKAMVFVVTAAVLSCFSVQVGHVQMRMKERSLRWITTQVPAIPDSDAVSSVGIQNSAQTVDTTQWMPLWDDLAFAHGQAGLADTAQTFVSVWGNQGISGITTAIDTLSIVAQVSVDGTKPVAVTETFAGPFLQTSSNAAVYIAFPVGRASTAANGTAPTNVQLGPYRFVRFIVTGDYNGSISGCWSVPVGANK